MGRWSHEVSANWLEARKSVLTATDVSGLMPEYKRYLKRGDPDAISPGFAALWCAKHTHGLTDTGSSDAAARGHVMEPYAVGDWNEQASPTFYHWDDCVIRNGVLGFSPDAMTVRQAYVYPSMEVNAKGNAIIASGKYSLPTPAEVMEVKCYSPEQHMKAIIEDRMEHKELMQLAMAFAVLPNLEKARLLWYCPGAPCSMFTEEYTADDLHDQVRWIVEIAEVYMAQAKLCEKVASRYSAKHTEEEIWLDHLAYDVQGIFKLKG